MSKAIYWGIVVCLKEAACVYLDEEVCTSDWSGALGRLRIQGWFLDR